MVYNPELTKTPLKEKKIIIMSLQASPGDRMKYLVEELEVGGPPKQMEARTGPS